MNKLIASIFGFFLLSQVALGASTTAVTHTATIQYNKNSEASVTIYEKKTTNKKTTVTRIDSYRADSQKEMDIINDFADTYNLSVKQAVSQSTFSYARTARDSIDLKKDDYQVSYKSNGNKTIMTVRINGVAHDYWMNTRNVSEANKTLSTIYSVSKNKFWNSLKLNKTTR